jgi:hypothetical protein
MTERTVPTKVAGWLARRVFDLEPEMQVAILMRHVRVGCEREGYDIDAGELVGTLDVRSPLEPQPYYREPSPDEAGVLWEFRHIARLPSPADAHYFWPELRR